MSNTPRTTRPKPPVKKAKSFDLDALEREDAPEPFAAMLGGQQFIFNDPQEMDWKEAVAIGPSDVTEFLVASLGPDQYEEFKTKRLPLWKLIKLSEAVQKHYGMLPEGEDSASSTS